METKYEPLVEPIGLEKHLEACKKILAQDQDYIKRQNREFEKYLNLAASLGMHVYYGIDGKPIRPEEYMSLRMLGAPRVIAQGNLGKYFISTVFLSVNHAPFFGPQKEKPKIFETMVFLDDNEIYMKRYSTYEEAVKGHQTAIDFVKKTPTCPNYAG